MKKLIASALALAILVVPTSVSAATKKGHVTNTNTCSITINGVHYDCTQPVNYVNGTTKIVIKVTSVQN